MSLTTRLARTALVLFAATGTIGLAGCSEDETGPGHQTVEGAQLYRNGTLVGNTLTLPAGQTVRLEVRFVDEDGEVITGLESGHQTALTFNPASLATVAEVTGQKFFRDVTATGAAGATGTVTVGYGHDAIEQSFGPFNVTIQ